MASGAVQDKTCLLCGGTGWKTSSMDRKVRTVERCDCQLAIRRARLLEQAEIPPKYAHCTLQDFDVRFSKRAVASLESALFYAKQFVENYPLEREGVLLTGPCGRGKTHLAAAMLKDLILKAEARCLFRDYGSLLKQIQATYSRQIISDEDTGLVVTEYSILQDVIEADVLVLDDLGAEKSSEWTQSMLYHVINERYNHGRTTIITTNLPWDGHSAARRAKPKSQEQEDAERVMRPITLRTRISEKTCSRIDEMCPHKLQLDGPDYRRNRRRARRNAVTAART